MIAGTRSTSDRGGHRAGANVQVRALPPRLWLRDLNVTAALK
jgi:hypothetical protein